jgi:hypothetical protein
MRSTEVLRTFLRAVAIHVDPAGQILLARQERSFRRQPGWSATEEKHSAGWRPGSEHRCGKIRQQPTTRAGRGAEKIAGARKRKHQAGAAGAVI